MKVTAVGLAAAAVVAATLLTCLAVDPGTVACEGGGFWPPFDPSSFLMALEQEPNLVVALSLSCWSSASLSVRGALLMVKLP